MTSDFQEMSRSLLGGSAVYPGHSVTVGLLIMRKYRSLDAATAKSERTEFVAALSDGDIPGAGGCVWGAIDLLRSVRAGDRTPEQAVAHARQRWLDARLGGDHAKAAYPGQEQADQVESLYLDEVAGWLLRTDDGTFHAWPSDANVSPARAGLVFPDRAEQVRI